MDADNTQTQDDDLTQAADNLNEKMDSTAGDLEQLGDKFGQTVEDGLANTEQTIDNFLDRLDSFLGRF